MADAPDHVESAPADAAADAAAGAAPAASEAKKKKKKKDKVRSAWISFVGRIVAQVVGAVATIALGLMFVQKYSSNNDKSPSVPAADVPQRVAPARAPRPDGTVALAVLPLRNFSNDPQQEYFADGMTEALITDLSQIERLHVISRTSSMHYKDERKPLPEIARELGVDLIIEGSVAKAGDRVRVTAQLIDANTDRHVWARSYDRTLRDVLSLQAEIATAVAREVNLAVSASRRDHVDAHLAIDPAAYDSYLKGRQAWNRRTRVGFEEALRHFDQAIQKDANFALAYAGVADTYTLQGAEPGGGTPGTRAKAAAQKAIALDDHLAEAHASLGAVHHRVELDLAAAEAEFRRAIALNPGYATAHQWYAILLAEESRDAEATRHAQQAVTLDPLSGTMHQALGLIHYYGRRYQEAAAESRRGLELAAHLPLARDILARALIEQGQPAAAIEVCEQAQPPMNAGLLATLSVAHFRAGNRERADALVKELLSRQPPPGAALARWYAATGDREAALKTLARWMAGGGNLQPLKNDPAFDPIRSEARFAELVRLGKQARPRPTSGLSHLIENRSQPASDRDVAGRGPRLDVISG